MEISRNFIGPKEEVTEQKKKLIFDIVTRFETQSFSPDEDILSKY